MILVLLVFLGGVLTIVSPCILPVLPFVFARSEQPFLKSGLPMLAGMAVSFTAIATLAAVGGAWAVHINQYGRALSLVLLVAFALSLLSTRLADWLARPFVAIGNRLMNSESAPSGQASLTQSALLGVATGLLWAPCAGPILGLVLTGAAISGPNTHTTLLLFAYAAGAATSLGAAILVGGKLFAFLKKSLGAGAWIRRGLGVAVLLGVAAILSGWDTTVLTELSLAGTNSLEQSLIDKIHPQSQAQDSGNAMMSANGAMNANSAMQGNNDSMQMSGNNAMNGNAMAGNAMMSANKPAGPASEGTLPPLNGATAWLNSQPLTPEALRGKVVLVDFWTYSCINCLRSLPYIKSWYDKYKDHGLVVIGVHAPEFAFEKDQDNVRRAVADLGVRYPVALDNNYAIWQGFNNQYWPAHYFIDTEGRIRAHHFGEGEYDKSEQTIRNLLTEAGFKDLPPAASGMVGKGVEAAADEANIQSPETYIGYSRAAHFSSTPGFAQDRSQAYALPEKLTLNQWGLDGKWTVGEDLATLDAPGGKIGFRFRARDLHLVLGPAKAGKPVRFHVLIDGAAPGDDHGVDTDAAGNGVIREQRLYQLIRQNKGASEHTFTIEFPDGGVQAFSFTFG